MDESLSLTATRGVDVNKGTVTTCYMGYDLATLGTAVYFLSIGHILA